MNVSATIYNDTEHNIIIRNFKISRSSINIMPCKIIPFSTLRFSIIPIAGDDNESFQINVNGCDIKIWWNFIPNKGYGPFVEQSSGNYRIVKLLFNGELSFHVLNKNQLQKDKAKYLKQQNLDIYDIIEQTGFTELELNSIF
ncbi:hypothetical protein PIROE2DRAFT_4919 [Piromyces sp. E2]|nr:hypothetical protein PIROE2DRAFT_4919 [Piromyces sp. E2]|eukprot:OUM67628.1 hypothetical protein PIROE2DRAFT_4919 [Piromyces sp. E2]